jgi:SAM-dependent methyltransferase
LTHDYVGADISQYMVDYCQSCFQGLAFHQADMRQLPFQAGSFDSVFAICNLFDAVSHEERLQVLAEARRILAPGGLLVFSAHNRNWQYAGDGPRLHVRLNPVSQLRSLAEYCKSQVNHHRLKTVHRQEKDYALLSDEGHQFAMLHYYVTRDCQARQLADAGFRLLECLDENGQTLSPGDDDRANSCIHYVARSA